MTGDDMPKLTPQQRELVDRIFSGVTNRPPIEWTDYVREHCGTDVTVYDAVMTRLEELRRRETLASATIPSDPSPGEMDTRSLDMGKRFGQMIGRYRVIRLLGEGGMGSVFLAEQDRPKRSVALKVIRPGVVSATMLARFEQEAQVLGRLQHPGIAQIFDAGTADSGDGAQPYFVMEYVRGRSLLEYAEAYKVGTRQRMELIAKICDAVQHAHQKGVIHRDLKPGNILVTEDGQPKILDFGVARATDSDFQTTTLRTDIGQLIGTVPYMSPEQAAGDPSELDIRSDVYAMGVVGYELLAGRLPYDLKKKLIHEAVRVIREDEPTPLSSINKVFRGDVETIIRKALEKERMRRYQSASELAGDIRRYLADEPIVARPASVAYQLQKFAKRHRAIAGSAVVVTLTLIAATGVSAWWAVQATRSERVAEDALAAEKIALAAETDARKEAEAERAAANAASDFLVTSLAQVSPLVRGPTVTVAEVLKAGEGEIDTSFEDQPRARIELHTTYGRVYRGLNLYQRAEDHLRQALDLAKTHLPDDDPRQSRLMQSLGTVMFDLGRDREAVELIAEAESLGGLEDIVSIAETEMQWAFYLHNLGDYDMAEFYLRRALKKYESLDEGALGAATCLDHLGRLALDRGDLEAATELVRTAVTLRRQLEGEASIGHAYALLTLGYLEHASGRWAEAATVYRRARDTYTEKHDDDRKFMVQVAEMDLAGVLEDAAAAGVELPSDDAERDWTIERLDGIEWIAAISLRNRARVLHRLGHTEAGDDRFRRSVRVDQRIGVGDRAASIAHTRREWARLLAAADPDAAAEQYGLAMDAQREASAEDAVSALVPTLIGLGRLHLASGAADAARPLVDEALALRRAHVGADDWPIGPVELVAAEQHAAAGQVDDARDLAAHALGILRRGLGANDARTQRAETVARELESG